MSYVPVPATTVARPRSSSTAASQSANFSASVSVGDSPVVPQTTMPSEPLSTRNDASSRKRSRSTRPSLSNGVTIAVRTSPSTDWILRLRERPFEGAPCVLTENGKDDAAERARLVRAHCAHHQPSALVEREARRRRCRTPAARATRPELVRQAQHVERRLLDELSVGAQVVPSRRRGSPTSRAAALVATASPTGIGPFDASRSISSPPARLSAPATPAPIQR